MAGPTPLPRAWLLRALDLESQTDSAARAHDAIEALLEGIREYPEASREQLEAYAERLARGDACGAAKLRQILGAADPASEAERLMAADAGADEALIAAAERLFSPGSRVLVLGSNPLLDRVLLRYADRLEAVTVSEGRPAADGLALAVRIAEQAVPVRLITESQLGHFAGECDLAIAEAERVLPDGGVVARAGTSVLAAVCRWRGVGFYVLQRGARVLAGADTATFRPERRNPGEVVGEAPAGVQISNILYDLTPVEMITGYVEAPGVDSQGLDGSSYS